MRRAVVLMMLALPLFAQAASANVKMQSFESGLVESTGIVADHRGNVYVMSEFLTISKIAPDGTRAKVPFVPAMPPDPGPKGYGLVWGPDDALWFTCNGVLCHVDADGGGLIDSPSRYGTPGPDGRFWSVDGTTGTITRITVAGAVAVFPGLQVLPAGSYPGRLIAGPDDSMWFIYGRQLVSITASGSITSRPLAPTLEPIAGVLAAGPDGNLWVATKNGIARVSPSGQVLGVFPLVTTPTDIAAGPDGDVWFTYNAVGGVGRITPSGHVSEFSDQMSAYAQPTQIVRAADGGMWVTPFRASVVWRIDPDPPVASTDRATGVSSVAATLNASVDPKGGPTSAVFQWGTTTAYGASSVAQDMGEAEGAAIVRTTLEGLRPATTYHYRVVAVNGMRTVDGPDRTLTTAPAADPPEPPPVVGAAASDADHDGYPAGDACNAHPASVHPGAVDRPGDKIDQDCSGGAAAFGRLSPPIDARWVTHGRSTRFTRLLTGALPAHAVLTLRCTGRGCAFKTSRLRTAAPTKHTDLLRRLEGSRLRRGAVVELRLSRAGQATTIVRWHIGPPTRRVTACLEPRARKESRCS